MPAVIASAVLCIDEGRSVVERRMQVHALAVPCFRDVALLQLERVRLHHVAAAATCSVTAHFPSPPPP